MHHSESSLAVQGLPYLTLSKIMLQGAAAEGSRLRPLTSESPTNNPMPAVLLAWMPKQQQGTSEPSIQISLYSDPERTSTIVHLQMPVADTRAKQHYVLAGLGAPVADTHAKQHYILAGLGAPVADTHAKQHCILAGLCACV